MCCEIRALDQLVEKHPGVGIKMGEEKEEILHWAITSLSAAWSQDVLCTSLQLRLHRCSWGWMNPIRWIPELALSVFWSCCRR